MSNLYRVTGGYRILGTIGHVRDLGELTVEQGATRGVVTLDANGWYRKWALAGETVDMSHQTAEQNARLVKGGLIEPAPPPKSRAKATKSTKAGAG